MVTTCVCWYVALVVIITPLFLQVTVVAGPPVDVQVRELVVSLYTNMAAVTAPERKKKITHNFSLTRGRETITILIMYCLELDWKMKTHWNKCRVCVS